MNEIKELEILIKQIESKLIAYTYDQKLLDEICKLSKRLDDLIAKHCGCSNK